MAYSSSSLLSLKQRSQPFSYLKKQSNTVNFSHHLTHYFMMKRARGEDMDSITNITNYLMLVSGDTKSRDTVVDESSDRVFECKTCNRQFPSFQALGGHTASHKKPKLIGDSTPNTSPAKPKTHECAICGLEFAIGQALGGHMRRHRAAMNEDQTKFGLLPPQDRHAPIVKNSNCRRVLALDLNLTPSENKFLFGKVAQTVDFFL